MAKRGRPREDDEERLYRMKELVEAGTPIATAARMVVKAEGLQGVETHVERLRKKYRQREKSESLPNKPPALDRISEAIDRRHRTALEEYDLAKQELRKLQFEAEDLGLAIKGKNIDQLGEILAEIHKEHEEIIRRIQGPDDLVAVNLLRKSGYDADAARELLDEDRKRLEQVKVEMHFVSRLLTAKRFYRQVRHVMGKNAPQSGKKSE